MAEQAVGSVASAVVGQITDITLSTVIGSIPTAVTAVVTDRAVSKILENLNQQTAAVKLQQLEMLLIKTRSTIEVSEKRAIKSAALILWQDKLKGAATRGEEVLLAFQQREADADEATRQNVSDQQQQEGSSSGSVPPTALSFTRKALSGMARRVITTATALFPSDEEVKRLNGAVKALEKESANIGEFIALLQLEASPKLKLGRGCKRKFSHNGAVAPEVNGASLAEPTESQQLLGRKRARCSRGKFLYNVAMAAEVDGAETTERRELHELAERLRQAMSRITFSRQRRGIIIKSVKWLAHWADVLKEARLQGFTVLEVVVLKEIVKCDLEIDQLRSFVHSMESLAGDAEYFNRLVDLCPRNTSI